MILLEVTLLLELLASAAQQVEPQLPIWLRPG